MIGGGRGVWGGGKCGRGLKKKELICITVYIYIYFNLYHNLMWHPLIYKSIPEKVFVPETGDFGLTKVRRMFKNLVCGSILKF